MKIVEKIRLLFTINKKESYLLLYYILGFYPKNITFYEEALLHKSSSKGFRGHHLNNERLEFLGDAVLNAVIADIIYQKFPNRNEGFLTDTRSKIVKRETMNQIAKELGLHCLIVSCVNNQKSHILGNALEAFIGAIYLDRGYQKTHQFIETKIIRPYIDIEAVAKKEVNFKSKLLEWSQK
ncbi:MAG: ribonuclease III, partial [Dysgonamonadaceae bacterium]|nr:ribonuclease III [Dysgonamonadaceae bacterium]